MGDVQVSPDANGQPVLTAAQSWTFDQPGSHTIQVRARNRANAEGTSPLVAVTVSGPAGPTVTPTSSVSPSPCSNNSAFISDVTVPDGTRVEPGARVDKVWRLQNTGTCEWGAGYRWAFVAGEQMGAPDSAAV
ncbi:MAG: hypothetical protein KJ734_11235, partial [Chloroflexi bacterium]|nr:hypothetical protein [Chloroflexota bacterium]